MKSPSLTIVVRDLNNSPRNVLIHASLKSISETQISSPTFVYAPQLKSLDEFIAYGTDNVTVYATEPPDHVEGFLLYLEAGYFLTDDLLLRVMSGEGLEMYKHSNAYGNYGCSLRYPDGKIFSCKTGSAIDGIDRQEHLFRGPLLLFGSPWDSKVGYQYTMRKLQYYFNMSGAGFGNIGHGRLGKTVKSLGIVAESSAGKLGFSLPPIMEAHEHTIVLIPGVKYDELIQDSPLLTHSRVEPVSSWSSWGKEGNGFYLGMDMVQAAFIGSLRYGASSVVLYPPIAEENLEPVTTCKKLLKRAIARMGYILPSKDIKDVSQDQFCLWHHMRDLLEDPNHA